MLWLDRFCALCGEPLSPPKRADAFFCAERHEAAWRKARKQVRCESNILKELELLLTKHRPKKAVLPGDPDTVTISYGRAAECVQSQMSLIPASQSPAPQPQLSAKEKLEETKYWAEDTRIRARNDLLMDEVMSHKDLHDFFHSMSMSVEQLRQVIMNLGKQDLQERLELQRILSEQTRQGVEAQLKSMDVIQERMAKLEPQNNVAELTSLGRTLVETVGGIFMTALTKKRKGKKGKLAGHVKGLKLPPQPTEEQADKILE